MKRRIILGIYVVTHKKIDYTFPDGYKTIIVNANKNKIKGDVYDNTGVNISNKNYSYCELTAIYWLWKNSKDDYIGIDHYRRFFINNDNFINNAEVKKILKNRSVILPKKESFHLRVGTRYWETSGYKNDLKVIEEALRKIAPEYIDDYNDFLKERSMYCYNMAIMNRSDFNDYCSWLFSILFEVEKQLDKKEIGAKERKGYYKRIYGFMAERLLNVYVIHNKLNVVEKPIYFTGPKAKVGEKVISKLGKLRDKYLK